MCCHNHQETERNHCAACGCIITGERNLCVFCNADLNYHIKLRKDIDTAYCEFLDIDIYSFTFAWENRTEHRRKYLLSGA